MSEQVVKLPNIPVAVYTRGRSPNWYVRVRLPGDGRYRRKSTNTTVIDDAKQLATQFYYELVGKKEAGIQLDGKRFSEVAQLYCNDLDRQLALGEAQSKKVEQYKAVVNRYLVRFFGNKQIDLIANKDITDYTNWRKTYWMEGPGKQVTHITYRRAGKKYKKEVTRTVPSAGTIRIENIPLRSIFKLACANGWMKKDRVPEIPDPSMSKARDKRAALTREQYKKLLNTLPDWIEQSKIAKQRHYRTVMRYWLPVMVGTGMRVGKESSAVKWKDYQFELSPNSNKGAWRLVIRDGKTVESRRKIVMGVQPVQAMNEWKSVSEFTEPEDFIFCNPDGSPLKDFGATFKNLCDAAGITEDAFGRKFTPYCLRHSYINFMLQEGVDIWKISKNSGNSPDIIRRFYAHDQTMDYIDELAGDESRSFLGPNTIKVSDIPYAQFKELPIEVQKQIERGEIEVIHLADLDE